MSKVSRDILICFSGFMCMRVRILCNRSANLTKITRKSYDYSGEIMKAAWGGQVVARGAIGSKKGGGSRSGPHHSTASGENFPAFSKAERMAI